MPVYFLTDELIFPHPAEALEDGLLAVGGDLSLKRLLLAYRHGIFPWYSQGSPIIWWSPDPRMVLFPEKMIVSKSLRQVINRKTFDVKFDHNFGEVLARCASAERKGQHGTWITREMITAYRQLHQEGYAHSVETYSRGELAGGLYGIALGKVFFGESMFFLKRDASKVALYYLVEHLKSLNFKLIDVQQETGHLKSLGAEPIPREQFLKLLEQYIPGKPDPLKWKAGADI